MVVHAEDATDAKKICAAKYTGDASTAAWDAATVTEITGDTLGTSQGMDGWRYDLSILDATPVIHVSGTVSGVKAVTAAALLAADAGTGYAAEDVLTVDGGTAIIEAEITVDTVSAGAIATVSVTNGGVYTTLPANPVTVTGGTGSGAGFVLTSAATGVGAADVVDDGADYEANDELTVSGGTSSEAAVIKVLTVTGGNITTYEVMTPGVYTAEPSNPVSVTGGAGTGATFNLTFGDVVTGATLDTFIGLNYEAEDILTVTGGTSSRPCKVQVDTVNGSGSILTLHVYDAGHYSVAPSNPVSVTGGAGNDDVKLTLTVVEDSIHGFASDLVKALNATTEIDGARYAPATLTMIAALGGGGDDLGDKTITLNVYPPLVAQTDGSPANQKVNIPGIVSSVTDGGSATDNLEVVFATTTTELPVVVATINKLE